MTLQILKTKAEQSLAEQFEKAAPGLPGLPWVKDARKRALGELVALGLPHRRIEEWKYTDLRTGLKEAFPPARPDKSRFQQSMLSTALGPELASLDCIEIVFLDGEFLKAEMRPSDAPGKGWHLDRLAKGLGDASFGWMRSHYQAPGGRKGEAMLALNTAFASDGALLRIEPGAELPVPIHLVFLATADKPASTAVRNLIEVGKGAKVTLIESHVAAGGAPASQTNAVTDIAIGDGAHVAHIKRAALGSGSAHIGTWLVKIGAEASYRAFQLTNDTSLVRNQLYVTFAGADAKLDISGSFLARGHEHLDTTLVVDHAVPGCESRELFKGVLDGQARGVFQGKIIVRTDAQKTDGKQMAQALMLSPDAEFDSKPELEIYADDVACGHGSTAAELDADLLFYCRSRGIPLSEARALLTRSFVGEALDKVEHEAVREALAGIADRWLSGGRG